MTQTAERLGRLGRPHARARAAAALLASGGALLAIAAIGLRLAPRALPIVVCWIAMLGVAGLALWGARRARRGADAPALGRLVEQAGEMRAGSVLGTVPPAAPGASPELFALADRRAASRVADVAPRVDRALARGTRRRLAVACAAACAGAVLFLAASPARGRAAFWRPWRALADAGAPVRLTVDRDTVRRGDSVTVTVAVPSAVRATLLTRGPGEPWRATPLPLDGDGRASRTIGPLEADLYLKATSGSRASAERRVAVALPAFITELGVVARFPAYLGRDDQQVVPGPDTVPLPAGTELLTAGALSVGVGSAAWVRAGGRESSRLAVRGSRFSGRLVPAASATWRLEVATADGTALEREEATPPELHLRIVPDSAPTVAVLVPGRDTMLPLDLRQPLVIDVRDDHGITRVQVVSWRASQTGKVGAPVRQGLDVSGAGDRALIQGVLDAAGRGLLPGDTLRFRVDAWDNAPVAHQGQSPEFALRLPSLEELRAATRAASRAAAAAADSLVAAQGTLSAQTQDLAEGRWRGEAAGERPPAAARTGALPFEASERAAAIQKQQADLEARARQLAERLESVARAAQAAGLTDTAFQARLAEVQQLLRRALSPELEQRLRELREALGRLDPEAARDALQRLAAAQRQLREDLERSRDLFRRAAIEGELASLAADAEDLRRRQAQWNGADAPHPDSAAAGRELALATGADSLARGLDAVARDLAQAAAPERAPSLAHPQAAAEQARGAMREAAGAAGAGGARAAASAGAAAESALAGIPGELRERRDSIIHGWRREAIDALDRALVETADLTARQQDVAEALHRGDASAATRSRQASIEEGAAVVAKEVRAAQARHALVSPQLERAFGFAQHQMRATEEALGEANPGLDTAATLADESVDALNAAAHAIARSRRAVSEAKSGTGFAEAMEQLTRLAGQQGEVNGQSEGLLPMFAAGGQTVLDELRAIAAQQRSLADQLDRMRAEGAIAGAGPLAEEARDLAAHLEAGRLDPQTIRRQSLLYHRLLDAGRTLQASEPDEHKQRVSETATIDSVHLPAALAPGATGAGLRLRYPTWDELRGLTPEQRRLVLEYFRRLNTPGAGGQN